MARAATGERWRLQLILREGDTGGPSQYFDSSDDAEREKNRWYAMKAAYPIRLHEVLIEKLSSSGSWEPVTVERAPNPERSDP